MKSIVLSLFRLKDPHRSRNPGPTTDRASGGNMARLFWFLLIAAFAAMLVMGASWAVAYNSVGGLLGSPPPEMGKQSTSIQWQGLSQLREHPPVWRFAFAPTRIPGAAAVRIYVNPWGKIVSTEPADLEAKLRACRRSPY
jgi:hypothetical protein